MTPKLKSIAALLLCGSATLAFAGSLDEVSASIEQGRYEVALRLLKGSGADNSLQGRFLLSTALAGSGRTEEAIGILEDLIKAYPERPEPYNNLAALYAAQGDFETAKQVLERAIRTNESYATVYDNLSTVYVEMARSSYAKALRVKKSAPPELDLLTRLNDSGPMQVAAATPAATPSQPMPAAVAAPSVPAKTAVAAAPEPAEPPATAADTHPKPAAVPVAAKAPGAPEPAPVATKAPAAKPETVPPAAAAPPAVPAAAAEPVRPVADTNHDRQAVIAALQRWAGAWSAQEVDDYLSAYGPEFKPDDNLSRARWEAVRRNRLKRPEWIEVQLSDFDIDVVEDGRAVVQLAQEYRSNTFGDRTLKRFELVRYDGAWRIRSEETLKTLR